MEPITLILTYGIPAALATVLLFTPKVKDAAEHLITLFHEFGHIAAITLPWFLVGARPALSIRVYPDGGGDGGEDNKITLPKFGMHALARSLYYYGGYAFPIYAGISLFVAVHLGHVPAAIAALSAMGILRLVLSRNGLAALVSALLAVAALGVAATGNPDLSSFVVILTGTLLLVGGTMDIIQIGVQVFNGSGQSNDFDLLSIEVSGNSGGAGISFVLFLVTEAVIFGVATLPLLSSLLT